MAGKSSDPPGDDPRAKMAPRGQPDASGAGAKPDDLGEEKELWVGRASARFFYGRWVLLIVISIVVLVAGFWVGTALDVSWAKWVALGLVALAIVVLLAKVAYCILAYRYRVTTQRLFVEEGILLRTVNQTDLVRVNDVSVTQTLLGRLFNVGSVTVDCPTDVSHPKILIFGVEGPHEVAEHIHREMRSIRDRRALMMEAT